MPKIVRSTDELINFNITGALNPASGTTAQRPSVPVDGQLRFNSTIPGLEVYVNATWNILAAASGLGSFVRRDGDTMVGTLTFLDGFQLIVDETGTVTAPAMAFDGDLNTGIYQNAGNILGVTAQGVNVALFDGSVATPVNHFTFSSSATATAPIISNDGSDTTGVGLGLTIQAKTATAAGNGGPLTLSAGAGNSTGIGGLFSIAAGASAGASGTAGSITIDAGAPTGGAAGSVTIAGTNGTLTLGATSFPIASTAIGILALTTANTLTAVDATTGGATFQILQFNDTGDVFEWVNRDTIFNAFSAITTDAGTITAEFSDNVDLVGSTNGGIRTVGTEEEEIVRFSITPTDLTTTAATIVGADFLIVSDSGDSTSTTGQKVTLTALFNDTGVLFTGGTNNALTNGSNNGTANTGVTVSEFGDGYNHVTVMTVSQIDALTLGDLVALADGYLLYTFPVGVCVIESTHMSMALTAGSAQLQADTPDVGLGTTIASGAFSTLDAVASTAEDIITGQTADDSNGTEEDITLLPTAGGPFIIEAGDTHTLHFNVANTWSDDTTPDLTADISGTVTIHWTFLGV